MQTVKYTPQEGKEMQKVLALDSEHVRPRRGTGQGFY